MIKTTAILEVKREDRIYTMVIPPNAPLGELHDALFEMRSIVIDRINAAINADKPKAPEEVSQVSETPTQE